MTFTVLRHQRCYPNVCRNRRNGISDTAVSGKRSPQLAIESTPTSVILRKDDDDKAAAAAPRNNNAAQPTRTTTKIARTRLLNGQSPSRFGTGLEGTALATSMEMKHQQTYDEVTGDNNRYDDDGRMHVTRQTSLLRNPPEYDKSRIPGTLWSQKTVSMPHTSSEENTDDEGNHLKIVCRSGGENQQLLWLDDDDNEERNTGIGLPTTTDRARRRRSAPHLPGRQHRKCFSSMQPSFDTVPGSMNSIEQHSVGDDVGKNALRCKTSGSSSLYSQKALTNVVAAAGLAEENSTVVGPPGDLADDVESSTFVEDVAAIRRLLFVNNAASGSTTMITKYSSSASVSSTPRRSVNRLVQEKRSDSLFELETVL